MGRKARQPQFEAALRALPDDVAGLRTHALALDASVPPHDRDRSGRRAVDHAYPRWPAWSRP